MKDKYLEPISYDYIDKIWHLDEMNKKLLYIVVRKTKDKFDDYSMLFDIISEKYMLVDYIKNPKENGYSSFHIIALVPVSFAYGISEVKVEIQIRTIAMDFWASLEHKIKYKYPKELPENIFDELKECSYMINELDKKMSNLGGNLIEEFEQELLFNKDLQSKEIKMPDCYTTQVINKIIDSF